MSDILGRTITLPYSVRGALVTAAASITTGTRTILSSGDTAYPLDIIQIGFSNNSDAATTVTLDNDGTTIMTFPIAASSSVFHALEVPLLQNAKNTTWGVDIPDITGTTITVNAVMVKGQ